MLGGEGAGTAAEIEHALTVRNGAKGEGPGATHARTLVLLDE